MSAIVREALKKEKVYLITEQLLEYIQWLVLLHGKCVIARICIPFIKNGFETHKDKNLSWCQQAAVRKSNSSLFLWNRRHLKTFLPFHHQNKFYYNTLTIFHPFMELKFIALSCLVQRQMFQYSDYMLITNLMHWLLFIHKIIFFSTFLEPQVLIFRRIQLYTCSIWYCHSLWEFLVACWYTAWVRTAWRGKVVGGCLKTPTNNLPPPLSSHSSCVPTGHQELS